MSSFSPTHSSTYKLLSSSADETLTPPKLKDDFCYITCPNAGVCVCVCVCVYVCEGYLCSASVDPLGCLLPYLISWGLLYVHHINRFCCPLNSDSVWLVVTTSRISEGESLALLCWLLSCQVPAMNSCVTEGDIWQWPSLFSYPLPTSVLLLLALGITTTRFVFVGTCSVSCFPCFL